MESDLINQSKSYATAVILALPKTISYHGLSHTALVVMAAEEIGRACGVSDYDLETLVIAAWFHDTGYKNGYENHEAVSAKLADQVLTKLGVKEEQIKQVKDLIAATRMPQQPVSLLEKILCDADLYYLSTVDYGRQAAIFRTELRDNRNKGFSDEDWITFSKNFLKDHKYWTDYGREVLEERKRRNMI